MIAAFHVVAQAYGKVPSVAMSDIGSYMQGVVGTAVSLAGTCLALALAMLAYKQQAKSEEREDNAFVLDTIRTIREGIDNTVQPLIRISQAAQRVFWECKLDNSGLLKGVSRHSLSSGPCRLEERQTGALAGFNRLVAALDELADEIDSIARAGLGAAFSGFYLHRAEVAVADWSAEREIEAFRDATLPGAQPESESPTNPTYRLPLVYFREHSACIRRRADMLRALDDEVRARRIANACQLVVRCEPTADDPHEVVGRHHVNLLIWLEALIGDIASPDEYERERRTLHFAQMLLDLAGVVPNLEELESWTRDAISGAFVEGADQKRILSAILPAYRYEVLPRSSQPTLGDLIRLRKEPWLCSVKMA